MGNKPTKDVSPYVPRSPHQTDLTDLTDTTVQLTIDDPSSSKSMEFENVDPKQNDSPRGKCEIELDTAVIDLHDRLSHLDAEVQKNQDTILLLNRTIETLTNQVVLLSEQIKQSDPHAEEHSSSAIDSIQAQLYGLERTFSNSATSFEKGIRTLNYIVPTLIQNESILVKYIDKLVSIITIYEQEQDGKKHEEDDETSEEEHEDEDEDSDDSDE
jgi:hypothetical protein